MLEQSQLSVSGSMGAARALTQSKAKAAAMVQTRRGDAGAASTRGAAPYSRVDCQTRPPMAMPVIISIIIRQSKGDGILLAPPKIS